MRIENNLNLKKKTYEKIVKIIYETIFKLDNEDLLLHYEEVKKELIKRGVTNVWRCRKFFSSIYKYITFFNSFCFNN